MTTETTCLSSIWRTDDKIKEFLTIFTEEVRVTRNLILEMLLTMME